MVSEPNVDFADATKILMPDNVDITDNFYRITRQLQQGIRPPEFLELDKNWDSVAVEDVRDETGHQIEDHIGGEIELPDGVKFNPSTGNTENSSVKSKSENNTSKHKPSQHQLQGFLHGTLGEPVGEGKLNPDMIALSGNNTEREREADKEMREWENETWKVTSSGGFMSKCGKCGKNRILHRDARRLANYIPLQCTDLGITCKLKEDDSAIRSLRPR